MLFASQSDAMAHRKARPVPIGFGCEQTENNTVRLVFSCRSEPDSQRGAVDASPHGNGVMFPHEVALAHSA